MTKEQQKFYDIKNTTDYKTVGEDVDFKVIVDHENKQIILQFRETDSATDRKNNLSFLPKRLKLGKNKYVWTTKGYARAYQSTHFLPLTMFISKCTKYPNYYRVIRGWSFGSAMAKICAYHFTKMSYFTLDELTTFGDVKCFLNPFIKIENCKRIRQYVTINDFVTWCVPFYHRTDKCKVGNKFSIKKIFNTEYYHTHYEEYDYSKYE